MHFYRCWDIFLQLLIIKVTTSRFKFLMLSKIIARMIGCCGCFGFGFSRRPKRQPRPTSGFNNHHSLDFLLDEDVEDDDDCSYNGDVTDTNHGDDAELHSCTKHSEEILRSREQNGMICRQFPVKETHKVVRTEVKFWSCLCDETLTFCSLKIIQACKVTFCYLTLTSHTNTIWLTISFGMMIVCCIEMEVF